MPSQWPIDEIDVGKLRLDLRNVRVPARDLDEPAIAAYLVEGEDLLDLAQDILSLGYIDNELPLVVEEAGQTIVLEGNRRITVLKALRDSSILGRHAQRIERLASRYPGFESVTNVRVMVAPSREAASPLLARLHTGQPKKGWQREQQAIFYHAQLSDTITVDDLKAQFPTEARYIKRFVHMGEMRELVRSLKFKDPTLSEWVRTNKLPMTPFQYAYERPRIQEALGFSFGVDERLVSKKLTVGQTRGMAFLLEQIRSGVLNTRSPEFKEKAPEHEAFVETLKGIVAGTAAGRAASSSSEGTRGSGGEGDPGPSGSGSGSSSGAHGGTAGSGSGAQDDSSERNDASETSGRGRNRGETRKTFDMSGFEYGGTSPGMRRRFEELKSLDLDRHSNAAVDLLRTVLECSIKEFLRAKGKAKEERLTLGPCVDLLAKEFEKDDRMTALIQALKRGGRKLSDDEYSATTTAMNMTNHEPDVFADKAVAHHAWDRIKPIVIELVGANT